MAQEEFISNPHRIDVHATFEHMLLERQINWSWIGHAITEPEKIEEPGDGTRHYLRRITEHGDLWLRVVVDMSAQPPRAITVFFDRRLRNLTCD
jgi:hypothetical protein